MASVVSDPNELCNKLSILLAKTIAEKLKPALSQFFFNVDVGKNVSLDLSKLAASVFPELNCEPVDFVFKYDKDFVSRINANYKKIGVLQDEIQLLHNKLSAYCRKVESNRKEHTKLKDALLFVDDEMVNCRKFGQFNAQSSDKKTNSSDGSSYDALLARCIANDDKITNLEQSTALTVSKSMNEMKTCIETLEGKVSQYSKKCSDGIEDLYVVTDAIEQYGRRNILVIKGIQWNKNENTNSIVIRLLRAMGFRVSLRDIDRSHRIFRRGHRPPDIYVKLVNHDLKQLVYNCRDMLRNMPGYYSVYIDENLTAVRRELFQKVRRLEQWHSWTDDGKIYLSLRNSRKPVIKVITCENDLRLFYDNYF